MIENLSPVSANARTLIPRDEKLWALSQSLEASFLSEMLKAAGVGTARKSFGGGAGEDQFASLLVHEHAELLTQTGGIGLAQSIYDSLVRQGHEPR